MPSFAPGYIISRRRVPRPGPAPVQTEPTFPLPLKAASVEAKVSDFCASITVRQKFVNTEDSPIEAIYQFPLEDKATVSDFTAIVDGNKIKGTIQEKEEAKNTYDDAISSGHGAYLMEQDEEVPNVFTVNVGNLPPGKEVDIAITYVIELTFEEGQLRFCMPSNENPSYKALGATGALPQIKLRIDFHMTSAIRSLSSPSHPITFEFGEEPTQATVTLASDSPQAQAAKDFIVLTKLAKPHEPCGRVEVNEQGTKTVMVSLYPKLDLADDEDIYTEMIFIVDRSGSMSRSRINQVKDTLQIFLRSLGEGTMFNIIGFGTSTQHLFPRGSVEYNDKNLDVATKHVQTMLADLGGTNILKPLQQVLQSPTKEGYPRQLFILTDGEVGNTQECINFVRQHAQTTRVFTFGVGNDASQDLVQGLAKAGEGFYEFVRPGDAMEDKVLRQLRRAMQPALTDIEVAWKGAAHVQPAPFRLPPLFCGGRLVVYGIVDDKSSAAGEVEITVRAKTVLRPFEAVVKVDTTKAEPGTLFHKLAARTLLKDLEEGRSYMHDASGKVKSGAGDVKAEAVRISLQSGILCKHTAFVAVEERDEATEGTMQVRKIPITFEKPAVAARPHAPVRSLSGPATGRGGAVVRSRSGAAPVAKPVCKKKKASAPVCNKKKASAPAPSGTKFAMAVSSFGAKSKCLAMPATNQSELCLSSSISENYSNDLDEEDEDEEEVVVKKEKKGKDRKKKKEKETEKKESQPSLARRSLAAPSSSVSSSSAAAAPLSSASPQSAVAPPPTQMREIIMKQKANGSWDWSDAVSLVRQSADQLRAGIPAAKLSKVDKEVEALWATAVVAAYLSKNFAEQKTNWDLVVQKAIKLIARQKKNMPLKNADEELDWFQLALAFLA